MVARQAGAHKLELADIVRAHGAAFCAAQRLCSIQHRALRAIERCRTAALGGELRACDACGTRRGFLFPVKALSIVFRGKFLAALGEPRAQRALLADLRKHAWVVYAKRPFAGPEAVLQYLGRYTHRTAISNERLVSCDARSVRLRHKDYAHGGRRRVMELPALEFLRRFTLHVLPCGFNRIRHYGLLANRNKRALLAVARAALAVPEPAERDPGKLAKWPQGVVIPLTYQALASRSAARSPTGKQRCRSAIPSGQCPHAGLCSTRISAMPLQTARISRSAGTDFPIT